MVVTAAQQDGQQLREQLSQLERLKSELAEESQTRGERLRQLQNVLQIAGDSAQSIEEVEQRLCDATGELQAENARLHALVVRQRRQALINTFERFDVDMSGELDVRLFSECRN
eukprot:SAG31_NODE_136_length_23089_cov_8.825924_14_plen_114_part_00